MPGDGLDETFAVGRAGASREGADGGGPTNVPDQGNLAEALTVGLLPLGLAVLDHLDLAMVDHVEAIADLALDDHVLPAYSDLLERPAGSSRVSTGSGAKIEVPRRSP